MTTALKDSEVVREAFIEQADAYLIKPIEKSKIEETFKELELIYKRNCKRVLYSCNDKAWR